jgi:NADH-quinone oxidoreductase subunit N
MIDKPFIPAWSELRAFSPELWLIAAIIAVLLAPFFTRRSNAICALVALVGLSAALISAIVVGVSGDVVGGHFRGMLVVDPLSILWKSMLLLFVIGIIFMWFSTTASTMHEGDGPEFFTLLLGATLGMTLMGGTDNLLMIFLAVELASLPSYVLAGFRKTHRIGAEASLKYVLFGAASSSIMAYGLSLLYGLYGTLSVPEMAAAMHTTAASPALLAVAIFGLIVGLGFKLSAVPFHLWCPDVFEGASIDVSAFLSVASKGAAVVLFLRIFMVIAEGLGYQNAPGVSLTSIAVVIGVLGSITATVGNTAAFVQNNIKRLLAYSSISHAGYMLCALSLIVQHGGNPLATADDGRVMNVGAAQALLFYLMVYMFMNLGAFTAAGLIAKSAGTEDIRDYADLKRRNPLLALCILFFMLSLVGLPPFAGFTAKLNVMYVLGANGGWWWALAGVIGINTVFSLYYYMRVVRVMYLVPSDKPAMNLNPFGMAITMMCAAMLLLMFIGAGPMTDLTTTYGKIFLTASARPSVAPTTAPTAELDAEPVDSASVLSLNSQ